MAQTSDTASKKDKTPIEPHEIVPASTPTPSTPPEIEAEKPMDNSSHSKENFFEGFQDQSAGKKYRYILFAIFALLLIGVGFLLKPQIEGLFHPSSGLDNYSPVSQEPKSMHLDISNPDDELLTFDKTINISGKTSPKSSIVISNDTLNWGVDADDQGEFAKVIDLQPGTNNVNIYAFDPQGNNKVETRTIYYSEEKI